MGEKRKSGIGNEGFNYVLERIHDIPIQYLQAFLYTKYKHAAFVVPTLILIFDHRTFSFSRI